MSPVQPGAEVLVRGGTPDDAATIARFIHDLAAHDGNADACRVTVDDIRDYGFGTRPQFEVLLAQVGDEPAGLVLYFPIFSTWEAKPGFFVESLYVAPGHRGRGVGKKLMGAVAALASERGFSRVDWQVLRHAEAKAFYEGLGARHVEEFLTYRLEGASLDRLAEVSRTLGESHASTR